jgi:hypothetical protein
MGAAPLSKQPFAIHIAARIKLPMFVDTMGAIQITPTLSKPWHMVFAMLA